MVVDAWDLLLRYFDHAAFLVGSKVTAPASVGVDILGGAHGWSGSERVIPGREPGPAAAPAVGGKAKIQVCQGARHGDLADLQAAFEVACFDLQLIQRGGDFQLEAVKMRGRWAFPVLFAKPPDDDLHQPVPQRRKAKRAPSAAGITRNEGRPSAEAIEKLADHA